MALSVGKHNFVLLVYTAAYAEMLHCCVNLHSIVSQG